jgi:uncharacterized membrane protein YfcA
VNWLAIVLIGAGVGFLGGMFGKGGSAIATPLLVAAGVPPALALASPLPATVPSTLVAFSRFREAGDVDRLVVRRSIALGVPAAIAGAVASRWIDAAILVHLTDVLLVVLGLRLLRSGRRARRSAVRGPAAVAAVAVVVGLVAGLLANSGGFLLAPLYVTFLALPIRRALGSSLAVAAALAAPAVLVHAWLHHIDWTLAAVLAVATIPASLLGASAALRIDPRRLERIYGAAIATLGAALLVAAA